jgi:predicted O-methyltransferase YrrM
MEMTPERWKNLSAYAADVFGRPDPQLRSLMSRAVAAGLPDIAISADVGRLLMMLTASTNNGRGADIAVELGTLGGYSAIWIARGLCSSPPGRLITVELEPRHADFARREFQQAGLADRIEQIAGPALGELPALARRLGPSSIDVAFLDAVKTEYPDYLRFLKPMLKRGGLLLADNCLGGGNWSMDDPPGLTPERDAVDRFNRETAADPDFGAACIINREGLLVARRL